jgi:hypothetical protein
MVPCFNVKGQQAGTTRRQIGGAGCPDKESVAQCASNEVAKPEQGRVACQPAYQKTDHYYPAAQPPMMLAGVLSCLLQPESGLEKVRGRE